MTPDEAKRLGLEQVGWWTDARHHHVIRAGQKQTTTGEFRFTEEDDDCSEQVEPVYRVADPAALAEALAERDALRADNQRLREALDRLVALADTLDAQRSRAALSASEEP